MRLFIFVAALIWGLIVPATAVHAALPSLEVVEVPLLLRSGSHDNVATRHDPDSQMRYAVTFRETIVGPEAHWIRLKFREYHLGQESFVLIRSLTEDSEQRLTAEGLANWQQKTAYFNGNSLEVELHVASGESGIFFETASLLVGPTVPSESKDPEREKTLCGFDERVSISDNRIGRIMPVGCTGWLVSTGAYLTAGHCTGSSMDVIQFNVPASCCNGATRAPVAQDQFPIEPGSVVFDNGPDSGQDWAVFRVNPNDIGELPVQRYGGFYRMTRDVIPNTVRVTGFGIDKSDPGCGDPPPAGCPLAPQGDCGGECNTDSQTEQTNAGAFRDEDEQASNDVVIDYEVDTEPGNSGSPVIILGTNNTVGIHTDGGCFPFLAGNRGTGFENNDLETAIRNFVGSSATFVDGGHTNTVLDGTVFRPFRTIAAGVSGVSTGGILSVVAGNYGESLTISKAMTIRSTVGNTIIGVP